MLWQHTVNILLGVVAMVAGIPASRVPVMELT